MSRYDSRLRSLEGRLGVDQCPACGSSQCVVVWIDDEHPDYHQPGCALCGQEPLVVVWDMRSDDELPRSEQPAPAFLGPPSSAAESVAAANCRSGPTNGPLDNNARAESQSKPRVRRRQYSG